MTRTFQTAGLGRPQAGGTPKSRFLLAHAHN